MPQPVEAPPQGEDVSDTPEVSEIPEATKASEESEDGGTVELKGAENPDPEAPKLPWWKRTRNRIAMIVGAVLVSVGIAVAAVSILPVQLTKVQVIDDFDAASIGAEELTNSIYASNVGYEIDTREVDSIEDNGRGAKVAHLTITYRNKSFIVKVNADQNYELSGRDWIPSKSQITSMSATPITPVDEARVLADMDTLMSKVAAHDGVSFATLYNGGEFEVESAELAEDDMSCTLGIKAEKIAGLYRYAGILNAEFEFVPGETSSNPGSWKLTKVEADNACWQRSLAPIDGEWVGHLDSTETSAVVFDTGRCYVGNRVPFTIEVKSFDVQSGTIEANVSFVSHAHNALSGDADGAEGDVNVELSDVSIQLDAKELSGKFSLPEHDQAQGTWELEFFNDAGSWRVRVVSSSASDAGLLWGPTRFMDTYTLKRSE